MLTLEEVRQKYVSPKAGNFNKKELEAKQKIVEGSFDVEKIALQQTVKEVESYKHGYPAIDLSFLSSSRQDGWPMFAVFSLDSPKCRLSLKENRSKRWESELTGVEEIDKHYSKFIAKIRKNMRFWHNEGWIETTFNGIIPKKVRENIRYVEDHFRYPNMKQFLIAESTGWEYMSQYSPPPIETVDPLIIGIYKGESYLIDYFDLSPIEDMVKREFTE